MFHLIFSQNLQNILLNGSFCRGKRSFYEGKLQLVSVINILLGKISHGKYLIYGFVKISHQVLMTLNVPVFLCVRAI